MKNHIRKQLRAGLNESGFDNLKWTELENDVERALMPIIEKNKHNFGNDSYGVIDAIHQVFDGMFQKK